MIFIVNPINIMFLSSYNIFSSNNDISGKASSSDLSALSTRVTTLEGKAFGMTVTYLCVISSTDNPTVEYFRSLIASYTLILFSGNWTTANGTVSAILHKDRLNLSEGQIIYLTNDRTMISITGLPLRLTGTNCIAYVYGIK